MTINNTERDRQRTHPHLTRLYLSVLVPGQVYCGTVGGAPSRGDRDITVVDVSGVIGNIVEGQTVLVGTSCGDDSISRRRFKSRAGQVLTVDENSVDWQVGDFITVLQNWELWSVYPRIIETAPDVWTFYKDYDVTYTDENLEPPPVAIAGPHKAGFLSSGSVTFTIDASDSYAIADGAAISTYAWSCTGGAIANANIATTTIVFNTAGTYWLTLVVTDDNGKTQTTRRVIFVHDRSANAPYTDLEFPVAPNGDWERGGWEMRIRVRGDASGSDFPDGSLVVLWCESWYAGTQDEIDGNVKFAGYIRQDTTEQDWDTGDVEFEATTIEGQLKQRPMFSVGLQVPLDSEGTVLPIDPRTWYEYDYDNLTVVTATHHLWRWHSTLLSVADVYLPTDNALLLKACDDFARGDLYTQVNDFAYNHGIFAHVACNRKGQVYVRENVNMLDDVDRAAVPLVWTGGVLEEDRRERIEIVRSQEINVAHAHLSGFSFDGVTATPIIAQAPGEAPEAMGREMKNYERQVLDDLTQAADLAGRVLASENNEYPEVRIRFAGHYASLDIMPQEWAQLSLVAGDTPREIVWTNQKLVCRRVELLYSASDGTLNTYCIFEGEAGGQSGVSEEYDPAPPPGPPPPPVWEPTDNYPLVAFDEAEGCWYRGPGYIEWVERDAGLPTGAVDNDNQGGWDAWWFTPSKQGTSDPDFAILWRCQDGDIYRSADCGVTWHRREPTDPPTNSWGDSPAPTVNDLNFIQRVDNIHYIDHHYFLAEWENASGNWRGWIAVTKDDGLTWDWISLITCWHVAPYYYAWDVLPLNTEQIHVTPGPDWGRFYEHDDAQENAIGPPDGDYFESTLDVAGTASRGYIHNQSKSVVVLVDFGLPVGNDYDLGSYSQGDISNRNPQIYGSNDPDCWGDFFHASWVAIVSGGPAPDEWYNAGGAWGWQEDTYTGVANYRYYRLQLDIETGDADGVSALFQGFRISPDSVGAANQERPIWADVDTEDGSTIILTVWEADPGLTLGRLYIRKYFVADLAYGGQFDLMSAWESEVENREVIAYPHTPLGDKDYIVVHGRMRGPFGLANPCHVIYTTDDGDNWSVVESSWGDDVCTALQVSEDQGGGARIYTGIRRNPTTGLSSLHRGTDSLPFVVPTPFVTNPSGVYVDALTISRDGTQIAIGSDASGEAVMVAYVATDDLTVWVDITDNYPLTGAVKSLVYL